MNQYPSKSALFAVIFHLFALILVLGFTVPKTPAVPDDVFQSFLNGHDPQRLPGSEIANFAKLIPPHETVAFFMDEPFNPYSNNVQQFYSAQSYLVPTVLSTEPGPRAAIIFCGSKNAAEKRLIETDYRLIFAVGDGKGVAVKN